jgi:hypothetical protein
MRYPDGYTPRREPHCGVLSVAIAAGVTFERAWNVLKPMQAKPSAWRGRTYRYDRIAALKALGVSFTENLCIPAPLMRGLHPDYLRGQGYVPRCTIATFARKAKPGVTYSLSVAGHVVTLRDGMVADQNGIAPAAQHWCARKIIKHIVTIQKGA